jgi:hypothetical protein
MAQTTLSLAQQLFTASARLRRTNWPNPSLLAEEIFSIFRSILEQQQADTSTGNTTTPSTTGNTTNPTTIGGVTVTKGDTTYSSGVGPNLNAIDWPGQTQSEAEQATPDPTLNPITLYGEVGNKVGGSTYSVTCWAKDPATNPPIATLTVRQGLIDADETIPSGTPVVVVVFLKAAAVAGGPFQVAGARMQVPVFLMRP